jgi:hypothetical protein
MMIPAMDKRILGSLSDLYLRSTPFQKETMYFFTALLSPLCSLPRGKMKKIKSITWKDKFKTLINKQRARRKQIPQNTPTSIC